MTLSADDRLDILELLARADNAATRRDAAAYVALFAEDGILDGEKGEHRGRQALADAVGAVWASEGPASFHLTINAVIERVPGHPWQAIASSTLLILDPGPPPVVQNVSTIVQKVLKIDGIWCIARRTVSNP
ncbi:MAG: nuclear transport factor 2 family protein [Acidimicrobiales bacterium]